MKYDDSPLRELTGKYLRPGGAALTRRGLALCGFAPGALVLDAGCGPGATLALLHEAGCAPIGLDLSPVLLAEARNVAPVFRADMTALPLTAGCLDGLVCECALSLAPDKAAVLHEWARSLKRGGRLLVSDLVRGGASGRRSPVRRGHAEAGAAGAGRANAPRNSELPGIPCAAGVEPVPALVGLFKPAGFSVLVVEDHTKALRELAARIVWHFGSLAAFTAVLPAGGAGAGDACDMGRDLGYCLVIAEKA